MLDECDRNVAVLLVRMHIPQAQSLKEKRMALRSIRDRIKSKFNVSVAELEGQEKWQTATFGFSGISEDARYLEECLKNILSVIESYHNVEVCEHRIEFL